MKPKILLVSDSARISSGFGRVVREIGTRLVKTGKYQIAQHGWFDNLGVHDVPFKIFPTRRLPDGRPNPGDAYGSMSFDDVAVRYDPEIVLAVGDPCFINCVTKSSLAQRFRSIFYCPADGFPLDPSWKRVLEFPERLVLFGDWPRQLIKKEFNIECHATIPHGVNSSVYRPPTPEERIEAKRRKLKDTDSFILGFIGRNSERKRVDYVVQAASILRKGQYGACTRCKNYTVDIMDHFGDVIKNYECRWCGCQLGFKRAEPKNVKLLMHTPLKENGNANLQRMAEAHKMRGNIFVDVTYETTKGCSDEELVQHYWAMDAYVSFAMEGWGLPILEAMSCGVPIITGNYSMPPEFCAAGSLLVDPETWIMEQRTGLMRPVPRMDQFLRYANEIIELPYAHRTLSAGGRAAAVELDWDNVAKLWEKELDQLVALPPKGSGPLTI